MKEEINKNISQQVYSHETDVNLDELWSGVQNELFPRKRKYVLVWLLPLILICAFTTYFVFNSFHEDFLQQQQSQNLIALDNKVNITKELTVANELDRTINESSSLTKQRTQKKKSEALSLIASVEDGVASVYKDDKLVANSKSEPSIKSQNIKEYSSAKPSVSTIQPEQALVSQTVETKINLLENFKPLKTLKLDNEIDDNFDFGVRDRFLEPILGVCRIRPNWRVSAMLGAGTFDSKRGEFPSGDFGSKLDIATTPLEYISGDLLVSYQLSNKIFLESGIHYYKNQERLEVNEKYLEDINGNYISTVAKDNEGNEVFEFQNNAFVNEVSRVGAVYNTLELVDLPITLGYNAKVGRLRSSFSVGILINMYAVKSGTTLSEDLLTTEINSEDQINMGIGYATNFNLSLPLFNTVHFNAGLTGSRRNITYNFHSEKLYSLGAKFGLGVQF